MAPGEEGSCSATSAMAGAGKGTGSERGRQAPDPRQQHAGGRRRRDRGAADRGTGLDLGGACSTGRSRRGRCRRCRSGRSGQSGTAEPGAGGAGIPGHARGGPGRQRGARAPPAHVVPLRRCPSTRRPGPATARPGRTRAQHLHGLRSLVLPSAGPRRGRDWYRADARHAIREVARDRARAAQLGSVDTERRRRSGDRVGDRTRYRPVGPGEGTLPLGTGGGDAAPTLGRAHPRRMAR
jgi:hypothetical protein